MTICVGDFGHKFRSFGHKFRSCEARQVSGQAEEAPEVQQARHSGVAPVEYMLGVLARALRTVLVPVYERSSS